MPTLTNHIRQANVGRKILKGWLGDGCEPVPIEQAQSRANICLSCPQNYKGDWLWNMATSLTINSRMKLRRAMNIHLDGDEHLGVCEVCGCKLRLKLHTPLRHIMKFTTHEMLARYPDACWLKMENKNNHSQTNKPTT